MEVLVGNILVYLYNNNIYKYIICIYMSYIYTTIAITIVVVLFVLIHLVNI